MYKLGDILTCRNGVTGSLSRDMEYPIVGIIMGSVLIRLDSGWKHYFNIKYLDRHFYARNKSVKEQIDFLLNDKTI